MGREESEVAFPFAGPARLSPWFGANSSISHILALYDLTDFSRWPHVTKFASLPDLTARLKTMDFDALSAGMIRWNDAALPLSLGILSKAVGALLYDGSAPPTTGSTSCV